MLVGNVYIKYYSILNYYHCIPETDDAMLNISATKFVYSLGWCIFYCAIYINSLQYYKLKNEVYYRELLNIVFFRIIKKSFKLL